MEIEAKINGIDELDKILKELASPKTEKKIIRDSLKEGAKVVLKDAKSRVKVGSTGNLKKSIKIVMERQRGKEKNVVKVGAVQKRGTEVMDEFGNIGIKGAVKGYHGHFIEYGIPSRGIAAQPFLRPAVMSKRAEFLDVYIKSVDKKITALVKKYAR